MNDNYWYALFVTTGKEDKVKKCIYDFFDDRYKVLVPKRMIRERKKGSWIERLHTLFPGYVLLNGEISYNKQSEFKKIPGVIRLICDGYEPMKIDEEEIFIINRLTQNTDIIGVSNLFVINSKVEVIDGPLAGLAGIITKVNKRKGRARVQLKFMGEPRVIDLPVNVIVPQDEVSNNTT